MKKPKQKKTKKTERVKVMGCPYGDLDYVAFHYETKKR